MAQDNRPRPVFVEEAEEALERIRRELDETRQRRRQASEAFDAFLRSFGPRTGREPRPVDPRSLDVRPNDPPPVAPPVPRPEPPIAAPEPVLNRAEPQIDLPRSSRLEPPPPSDVSPVIATPPPVAEWSASVGGHSALIGPPKAGSSLLSTGPSPLVTPVPGPVIPSPPTIAPPPAESALEALSAIDRSTWPFNPPQSPLTASQPSIDAPASASGTPPVIPELPSTTVATTVESEPSSETSRPAEPQIAEPPQIEVPPQIAERQQIAARLRLPAILASLRQSLQRGQLRREHAAAAVGAVVVLAALLLWLTRSSPEKTTGSAERGGATASAPAAASASAAASDAQPAPAQAQASTGFQLELRTHRLVWLRVIVDGERAIEREVPAGQTIPINGKQTVVIRAGDAGGVRVAINGEDQGPFGTDGFPATRTFTRPQ
jgi:hypothetical protein